MRVGCPQVTVTQQKPMDYAALGIKVGALEDDVREVKDSILGLDAKIEKSITSLAHEVRTQLASLASQFNERQRTPWTVLIAATMAIISVLGIFGSQALSPIQSEIKLLKEQIVPRDEIAARSEANNRRIVNLENLADQLQRRRYEETREEMRRLQSEIDYLRRNPAR